MKPMGLTPLLSNKAVQMGLHCVGAPIVLIQGWSHSDPRTLSEIIMRATPNARGELGLVGQSGEGNQGH